MARVGVSVVVIGAVAFVGGLVLGGVGPRSEVRDLEQQVFELERKNTRSAAAMAGRELTQLITDGVGQRTASPDAASGEADDPSSPARVTRSPASSPEEGGDPAPEPVDEGDPLEQARDLLAARGAQARAAFIEDANPSDAQLDTIDGILDEMNAELVAVARGFVDQVRTQGEPGRRDTMRTAADVLDIMVVAEDRMMETLDASQRDALREESSDPMSFVDPAVVDVLFELEGMAP